MLLECLNFILSVFVFAFLFPGFICTLVYVISYFESVLSFGVLALYGPRGLGEVICERPRWPAVQVAGPARSARMRAIYGFRNFNPLL